MTRLHAALPLFALGLALGALCASCDRSAPPAKTPEPAASAAPKVEPTAARLRERVLARWASIEEKDLVAAYSLSAPEFKREMPLAQYLASAQHHEYRGMKVLEILAVQGETGYVRVGGQWTPRHPVAAKVKLEPGQTLTQDLEIIETWRFGDGDWYFARPDRPDEFLPAHPELQSSGGPPVGSQGQGPGAAAAPGSGTPPAPK